MNVLLEVATSLSGADRGKIIYRGLKKASDEEFNLFAQEWVA